MWNYQETLPQRQIQVYLETFLCCFFFKLSVPKVKIVATGLLSDKEQLNKELNILL